MEKIKIDPTLVMYLPLSNIWVYTSSAKSTTVLQQFIIKHSRSQAYQP